MVDSGKEREREVLDSEMLKVKKKVNSLGKGNSGNKENKKATKKK